MLCRSLHYGYIIIRTTSNLRRYNRASQFISLEDMKQTLALVSKTNIFSHNSNPFYRLKEVGGEHETSN